MNVGGGGGGWGDFEAPGGQFLCIFIRLVKHSYTYLKADTNKTRSSSGKYFLK